MDETIVMYPQKVLFYEPILGRTFWSTIHDVESAIYALHQKRSSNKNAILSINYWYDLLGLPYAIIGDEICWNSYNMWGDVSIRLCPVMENSKPAIRLEYSHDPIWKHCELF